MADDVTVVLDPATGRAGPISEFVEKFAEVWADPPVHIDTFLDFLSPDIHLVDPVNETRGREDGYGFIRLLLDAVPSIRGVVDSWAYREGRLFIGMRFLVDRGEETVEIPNVDIFTFEDGIATKRVAHLDPAALLGT